MPDALKKADEVLQQSVQGITDLINIPGLINLDFADVKTVMSNKGIAHIGIGSAKGDEKAIEAMKIAVSSPLLETTIEGASHVLINISGDVSLPEVNEAASYVKELAGEEANIIFGATYDATTADEATITVIATGVEDRSNIPNVKRMMVDFKPASAVSKPASSAYSAAAATSQPDPKTLFQQATSSNRTPYVAPRTKEERSIKIPEFLKKQK